LGFELEHSKHRIKVACPIRKPDRRRLGTSQPFGLGSPIETFEAQDQGWKEIKQDKKRQDDKIQDPSRRIFKNEPNSIDTSQFCLKRKRISTSIRAQESFSQKLGKCIAPKFRNSK
jgi:hypothetical protein